MTSDVSVPGDIYRPYNGVFHRRGSGRESRLPCPLVCTGTEDDVTLRTDVLEGAGALLELDLFAGHRDVVVVVLPGSDEFGPDGDLGLTAVTARKPTALAVGESA